MVFRFTIVIILLLIAELFAYGSSLFLPRDFYYAPPTREQFLNYLEHAEDTANLSFGWLPIEEKLTPGGQRRAPNAVELTKTCVSLYGDSFTFGDEVPDNVAWGNLLIDHIGCRVDNYAVSGFGTDQAYLRFAAAHGDEARDGIEAINLGPLLAAHFVEKDFCYYVCTKPTRRSGHYTAAGNRVYILHTVSERVNS